MSSIIVSIRRAILLKGSKAALTLLEKQGVNVMFGLPGGTTIPLYDDLLDSNIRHVLVRHEQCAAHMADGYARATGRVGVCTSTSGPGVTNLMTGVATAYVDSSPMLVLTGQVATPMIGNDAFQEADSFSLMMPITKHNFRVLDPKDIPEAIVRGMAIATTGRKGPVHVDLPVDVMRAEVPEDMMRKEYRVAPPAEDFSGLPQAVQMLRNAERPLILVGGGVIWSDATQEVLRISQMLMAPIVTTIMGKGAVPEDHPLCLGVIGMHGRECARKAFSECDLVLALGTRFSDRSAGNQNVLEEGMRIIHVDIDSGELGKTYNSLVRIVGDAKKVLRLMIEGLVSRKGESEWSKRVRTYIKECECEIDLPENPIKPQKIIRDLMTVLSDNAFITTEVGQNQMWAAHFLKVKRPRQFITSGGFGTMGFGFPAALGVKVAFPNSPVVDIAGDGSIQMVFQEFATAVSENLPVVVCLMNNGWLGMVKQWQKLFWEKRYSGTELKKNPDFVKLAQAFGADGVRVERPSELRPALLAGLKSGVPFIVDVIVDPEEDVLPMIPPGKGLDIVRGRCKWK
ncbi:MAG: biosynthetic-type acetolactate synthase large subunit [Methanomassiliicoccales archaeon]|nr:biosynthetic-type acetolactate synthase large subunit [Methanomassiliicoccales archaeon]